MKLLGVPKIVAIDVTENDVFETKTNDEQINSNKQQVVVSENLFNTRLSIIYFYLQINNKIMISFLKWS